MRRPLARAAALSAAGLGYALWERRWYRLVEHDVDVGGNAPHLDVLHVSDTHMKRRDRALIRFLQALPDALGALPDLVLATGDLIENDGGIDPVVACLARLDARLGRFYVLGSHDYFQTRFTSYTKYFLGRWGPPLGAPPAAVEELEAGLQEKGWKSLTNSTEVVTSGDKKIRLSGTDDPYIGRHRTEHLRREPDDDLAIGLVHAPDIVSEFALQGYDLLLAGHTHAGQVRLPFAGALVTNCSLPAALAGGVHRVGACWLHTSPGLGTGKYQGIRFNCRPEVTLLRLRPAAPNRFAQL